MPSLATPRSLPFLIFTPPGSRAPTLATGTRMPASQLGAPQTICRGSPSPMSTVVTRRWSLSGWGTQVSTRPTTTFSTSAPRFS